MKIIVLLFLITLFAIAGYSQQQKRTIYLTVWFLKTFERDTDRDYYLMNAETGNATAPEVFDLVIYRSPNDPANKDVDFYHRQNDSSKAYFNYFRNPTAGLEYLGKKGWQLVSVTNEVSSDHKFVRHYDEYHVVTTVASRAMYYFKKEVD
jgi:hypothetical protein